jgi:hypothetical protein
MSGAMTVPTVVCFKWRAPPGYRSQFNARHVNTLAAMVRRCYAKDHNFVCVTDDFAGLDKSIRRVALWPDHSQLINPMGARRGPSCYRRLKLFARDAAALFGKRIIALDLDVVLTADVAPLFDRPEDFIIWGDTHPRTFYNGSFWSLKAGALPEIWEEFDPQRSPALAKAAGHFGSDQAWLSYRLGTGRPTFGQADGVYSFRVHVAPDGGRLPANARLVVFHGKIDPWSGEAQQLKWVRDNWRA